MAKRKGKTETGLEPNVAGLLCYVAGWVSGIVFLLLEKKDKFVRFHAIQSIIVFGAFSVVWIIFGVVRGGSIYFSAHGLWVFFSVIYWILWVFGMILWIILMVKAYRGEKYKLPVSGNLAEKYSK
jgi:uncharacterized membrane protein